jgi:peptide methionine sulfoxide reductase msrA/msrB
MYRINKRKLFSLPTALLTSFVVLGLYWQSDGEAGESLKKKANPVMSESIVLGMGCFWGAEKRMSALPGVIDVVSGYAGGSYQDPTYRKVLASEYSDGVVNHAEVVKVTFDPTKTTVEQVLAGFWENHDPTQGNRQGNDVGTNYRSAIYYNSGSQKQAALKSRDIYQEALTAAGFGKITTEFAPLKAFYAAEEYHQDYLAKNPNGYCGLGGTKVKYPSGMNKEAGVKTVIKPLDPAELSKQEQLIVFETEYCPYCKLFREQILDDWKSDVPIATSLSTQPPKGWTLQKPLWATPTIVLFRNGKEATRYTGYKGEKKRFRDWLSHSTLSVRIPTKVTGDSDDRDRPSRQLHTGEFFSH